MKPCSIKAVTTPPRQPEITQTVNCLDIFMCRYRLVTELAASVLELENLRPGMFVGRFCFLRLRLVVNK